MTSKGSPPFCPNEKNPDEQREGKERDEKANERSIWRGLVINK